MLCVGFIISLPPPFISYETLHEGQVIEISSLSIN